MIFDIEAPDGRIFSIEGDSAPTEQELETFFGSLAPVTNTESAETSRPDLSNHDIYDTLKSGPNLREKLDLVFHDKEASLVEKIRDIKNIAIQEGAKFNPLETGKSGGRGIGYLISNVGKLFEMCGEQSSIMPISPAAIAGINIPKRDFGNLMKSVGGLFEKGGEAISDSKIFKMDEEYKKEIHSGTFIENPSFARIADVFMESAPPMAVGYGIGALTKSTKAAALALSFLDSVGMYEEARESGKDVAEATTIFGLAAGGTYFLEKYGLDEFFDNTIAATGRSLLKKVMAEGLTETGQTFWQNLVAKIGYDESRSLAQNLIESGICGALGAGIFHSIGLSKYNDSKKKLVDFGYSEEQAESIMNGVVLEVAEHKKVLTKHFEDNIKKFVEQGEAELAQMDANKFYQFKKEAREVEAKILNEMRLDEAGFSDEEIYDMSSIITSQVYAMALMQGTTPANIKLPQIVLEQNAKFLQDLKSKNIRLQTAFHGTHQPELEGGKFDLEKAGSGEGHAAHGHGVYATVEYNVADKKYRKMIVDAKYGSEADFFLEDKLQDEYNKQEKIASKSKNQSDWDKLALLEDLLISHEEIPVLENGIYSEDVVNWYNKEIRNKVLNKNRKQGQVYELDVPENTYLLNEQLKYENQPDIVKQALDDIFNSADDAYPNKELVLKKYKDRVGASLYNLVAEVEYFNKHKTLDGVLASDSDAYKLASEALDKKGVKGITYDGREDGRSFVVFNPDNVKIINRFYKDSIKQQGQRGAYIDGKIYLFEGADVSTVMHEFMHHWQDQMKAMGTKKSQEILAKIDEWSTAELSRKYDVKQVGNKFKIVDKKGNTVYNNLGRNFDTEAEAVAYAKDELFAQGFEQYLSTGKAPNKTLENVFQSFFHYMKKIFAQTKALDIELTPEMKQVYADILGGASIDTFRNKTLEEFIKERADEQIAQRDELNRIEESGAPSPVVRFQEDIKDTDVVIKEALDKTKSKDDEKNKKEKSKLLTKMMTSLSTRAKEIHPHLKTILTRYFSDINVKTEDRLKSVKGFLDGMKKIKQTDADDYARMDLAIKNSDIETMIEIAKQYDFVADLNAVRAILDEMFVEAEKYGLKVDFKEDYFPRSVKDYKGLVEHFTGKEFSAVTNSIEKVEKAMGRNMTDTEVANHINMNLRRIANTDLIERTNHRKGRTLDTIDEVVGKYFENSDEALVGYIETMTRHIEAAKILGVNKEQSAESVGNLVNELYKKGEIKRSELDEAQDIIHAALDTSGITYSTLKVIRDTGYLVSMGNFTTAIAQLDDFASTMTHAGFFNAIKALTATGGVDISDIGIRSIGEEFKNPEKLGGLVSGLFKSVGLTKVDNFIKNTFIKGDEIRMKKMPTEALADEIAVLFYDDMEKATQVAKDIQAGKKTEDTLFVYYNNLSKYQPISRFEMPEYYRGNARIFYTLKSFTLKRIDVVLDDIKTILSSEKSTPMQRKAASQHLWKWIFALSACGLSKELLIDLLLGRKIDIDDAVVNTMLGYIGMNRYYLYRAESYGIGDAVNSIVFGFPIINFSNIIQKDFTSLVKGKKDFGELDAWKFVPYIGKVYYERLGGGKDKNKGKGKKGGKKFY